MAWYYLWTGKESQLKTGGVRRKRAAGGGGGGGGGGEAL